VTRMRYDEVRSINPNIRILENEKEILS
jgi:hypothetical protein